MRLRDGFSTINTTREQLSKLQPPRWTQQQMPKRIYNGNWLRYNAKQIKVLNKNFATNQNPTSKEFQLIANEIGVSHYQVKTWFQNQRRKQRKSIQKQYNSRI